MRRKEIDEILQHSKTAFEDIADQIWSFAETNFKEYRSCALQAAYMEKQGFRITTPIAGMDSAFIAEWGYGKPVIALLGEFDALANQSQIANAEDASPLVPGAPGHGCGHNMLGTGCMEAACAVKEYLESRGLTATVRYYGCPAEEGGGGKIFMAIDGAFDDVDCTFTWHPGNFNGIDVNARAIISVYFRFTGIAAHATGAPWSGRSALDAVELMNVGVNFLREHVKPDTHMQYAIIDSGGPAANVVQKNAEVYYILRSRDEAYLREVYDRVCDIARGAALMTGTKLEEPVIASAYATQIRSETLERITMDNLKAYLPFSYSEEELAYLKKYQLLGTEPTAKSPVYDGIDDGSIRAVSSDVADVSWFAPLSQLRCQTVAVGTPSHSWLVTAQGKSSTAYKGMHAAGAIMANCILDVIEDPALLDRCQADFRRNLGDRRYKTMMEGHKPSDFRYD